jgi:predicted HTH transcriptional regulator
MLNAEQLKALMADVESDTAERIESTNNTDKFGQAICAFANEQEERALSERRAALAKSFDAQPCSESKIDDLALGKFDAYRREAVDAETIAANHRPLEQQLASLRLYDPDRSCATHAGLPGSTVKSSKSLTSPMKSRTWRRLLGNSVMARLTTLRMHFVTRMSTDIVVACLSS